ncbi:uncharacterized protein [Ranitomeya imitator]|uniref:uncharacterized protein n=1 Tax=Ranitomeya imitator TaxID=111125 RepID=UPI0037E78954
MWFCRERMAWLLLVTVSLAHLGLVTAKDPILVYGQLGSDLILRVVEACEYHGSYRFDLLRDTKMIGTYHDGLQGLNNYSARLMYDRATCTITLKSLSAQDGTRFNVTLVYNGDQKPNQLEIAYKVIIHAPTTSGPSTPAMNRTQEDSTSRNGTQVSDGALRLISFCLSLDSVVNAALGFLLLILQGSHYNPDDRRVNVASKINHFFTVITEIFSIGIMLNGFSYTYILFVIPMILFVDIGFLDCFLRHSLICFRKIFFCCSCCGFLDCFLRHSLICFRKIFFCCSCRGDDFCSRCKRITWYLWSAFILLIQVLFAVFVGLLSFGDSSRIRSSWIGYLLLSLVLSMILRCAVSIITYHCYKATFAEVPPDDPTKTTDDPEKETSM